MANKKAKSILNLKVLISTIANLRLPCKCVLYIYYLIQFKKN